MNGQGLYKKVRQFLSKKRTRTYIVPSAFGFAFGAMALILFFLAVGYANNLIYIFVFFLISVALTSVLITNKNVDGLEAENILSENNFADERGSFAVPIKNFFSTPAWEVSVFFEKTEERTTVTSISPGEEESILIYWTPAERGVVKLPRLILQSTFPFGLLRAWKVFKKPREVLIYPARKGEPQFPQKSFGSDELKNSGLFRDHREYQSSDSMMRIDWRASARRQELLVKNFEEMEKPSLQFSWEQTSHLADFELRLSQLCLWIDEAEKQGHQYSLQLGTEKTARERGPSHWKTCLEILALARPGEVS